MAGEPVSVIDAEETLALARSGDEQAFRELVAPHQRELRAYCYRMSGSLAEADDLVQESLVRAWRGLSAFQGHSSVRTWLYRVTWSACVEKLASRPARFLAIDLGPPADPENAIPAPREGFIEPCPSSLYTDPNPSPEARYSERESVALSFLAALQLLTPKQRAILLARDVLGFRAEECAEWLGASVASVNSALQRAREAIDEKAAKWRPRLPDEPATRALLARYVEAWERADVDALVGLLHDDATLSMPPLPMWLRGARAIGRSIAAMVLTPEARGAFKFVVTEANGLPCLAAYQRGPDRGFSPAALHVLRIDDSGIAEVTAFLDPRLFASFALPAHLPG